jgi:hypothetical protein
MRFFTSGFYVKWGLLGPIEVVCSDFDFFSIFVELFDYLGASPVSMALVKYAVPVSTSLAKNSSPVSTTPVIVGFVLFKCFPDNYLLVSITLAKHDFTGVVDTGEGPK